jgi:hypothetical protein
VWSDATFYPAAKRRKIPETQLVLIVNRSPFSFGVSGSDPSVGSKWPMVPLLPTCVRAQESQANQRPRGLASSCTRCALAHAFTVDRVSKS